MIKLGLILALSITLALSQSCCADNTISVSGNAEVKVKPDIATFTVDVEDTQRTTSAALQGVNEKIASVVAILNRNGVAQQDYSTSSFRINTEYDFSGPERIRVGEKASQGITIKVRDIVQDGSFVGSLISSISAISGASINGVNYEQSDKSLGVRQARKAAFESAKAKAQEYARFSGQRLRDAIKIDSVQRPSIQPFFADAAVFRTSQAAKTLIPVRDVIVSESVDVVFSLLP